MTDSRDSIDISEVAPAFKAKQSMTYADELPCDEKLDEGKLSARLFQHPWVNKTNKGALAKVPTIYGQNPTTVSEMVKFACAKHTDRGFMGTRKITHQITTKTADGKPRMYWKKSPPEYETYGNVYKKIENGAKGLLELGGESGIQALAKAAYEKRKAGTNQDGDEVVAALLAETAADWMISAQAAMAAGLTITTVYATLGEEAMLHGLQETEAEIIFMEWSLFHDLKDKVLRKCPALKYVVLIGEALTPQEVNSVVNPGRYPTDEAAPKLSYKSEAGTDVAVSTLPALYTSGESSALSLDAEWVKPNAEDLALIMYTSGSTGLPKGVKLSHLNFVAVIASALAQGTIAPTPEDEVIAYLPLAHILELIVEVMTMVQGAKIQYSHPRTLTASSPYVEPGDMECADITTYHPTMMAAVPAILELIKNGLTQKVEAGGGLKAQLFFGAVGRKIAAAAPDDDISYYQERQGCGCLSCLDNVLLGKVKALAGLDRVRILISGGAPLSAATQNFAQAVFCPVAQGYGATETTGCATVQEVISAGGRAADLGAGRVGAIQPACQLKLVDVPEMKYFTEDNPGDKGGKGRSGEILLTGSNISSGYYKLPDKTAADFQTHADGKIWFHTGDIGTVDPDGVLRIVDRKKSLVKLAGGEYVSMGKVEAKLTEVTGLNGGVTCVFVKSDMTFCVVIVSQPEKGWGGGAKPVEAAALADIKKVLGGMKGVVAKMEIPTKVKITDDVWTPESGLVTASMKVARNPIRDKYNDTLLDEMGYKFPVAT
jgi:long-chain acyl-CoA synthetase